jgi:hypothetical protein
MSGDLHVPDEDVAERLDIAITDMWAGYDAVLSGLIDGLATAEARAYAKQQLRALRGRSSALFLNLSDLIPQAERRGAVKALRLMSCAGPGETASGLSARIESGEVTL